MTQEAAARRRWRVFFRSTPDDASATQETIIEADHGVVHALKEARMALDKREGGPFKIVMIEPVRDGEDEG